MTRLREVDDPRGRHVYYCYAADGTLLYVGQAMHVEDRLSFHGRYDSPSFGWFYHCMRDRLHNPNPQAWEKPITGQRPYRSMPDVVYLDALRNSA